MTPAYLGNVPVKLYRGATEVSAIKPAGSVVVPGTGNVTISSSVMSNPSFPITVSTDNQGYRDSTGKAFYGLGDTNWNAIARLSQAGFTSYLQTRRAQGFNTLYTSVVDINSLTRTQQASGQTPFAATGTSVNIVNRNLTGSYNYWDHLEWCIDQAAAQGFLCILIPLWYGYRGNMWRPFIASTAADTSKATDYGQFLASRLGDRNNLIWMLGGDNGPGTGTQVEAVQGSLPRVDVTAATNALGNALSAGATVPQLMTYHSYRGDPASAYFGSQPWYDIHAAYAFADVPADTIPEWNRGGKPVALVEAYYDARQEAGVTPVLTRAQVRGTTWHALTTGALVTAYGHEYVWGVNWRTGGMTFEAALAAASASDHQVISRVLRTFDTKTLRPDAATPLVSSNRGQGITLASALRSTDNKVGILYIPTSRTFTLNLSGFSGTPQLAWVHPETGATTQFDATGLSMSLTTPSGWTDSILVAEVQA